MVKLKLSGENHWRWIKDRSIAQEKHRIRNSQEYREWRKSVFTKDDYTCHDCNQHGGYLEAHHIKSWEKYPDLRYEVSNGITLCRMCHLKTLGKEEMFENKYNTKS
jgi:5-methylcytosine-specific restriction endonuclease McrA